MIYLKALSLALLASVTAAFGQEGLLVNKVLTLEAAKKIAHAAEVEANKRGATPW